MYIGSQFSFLDFVVGLIVKVVHNDKYSTMTLSEVTAKEQLRLDPCCGKYSTLVVVWFQTDRKTGISPRSHLMLSGDAVENGACLARNNLLTLVLKTSKLY